MPLFGPWWIIFLYRGEYFTMPNGVFNFYFLYLFTFRDIRGSQIYTMGPYAPMTPSSGKIFVPKASTSLCLIVFLISTF